MKNMLLFSIVLLSSLSSNANVLGNMQTLAPNPDSLFFQNAHSSKTLAKNYFNVGLFLAYVRNELSAYDNITLAKPEYLKYKDQATTFDFVAAWGVTNHFEVFYAMPVFLEQRPDSGQVDNKYISKGANVHRPGIKYDISQNSNGGFAVVASVDFPVTVDDPYVGTSPSPIYNIEFVRDFRRKEDAFGINLGYRHRNPGQIPANNAYFYPLKSQVIGSLAYMYGMQKNWRFHAEVYGATSTDKSPHPESKHVSALEGLLGYKHRVFKNFWAHVGATAELMPEGLAPDYRVYAGLNYFFGLPSSSKPSKPATAEPLKANPTQLKIGKNESRRVLVEGGARPYSYRLKNDFGTFDEKTMTYQAPNQVGQNVLIIQDNKARAVEIPITVISRDSSMIDGPDYVEVFEGSRVSVPVAGGEAPLRYRVENNFGYFDAAKRVYLAPTRVGETRLIVTDAMKREKYIRIVVKEIPKANKEFSIQNLKFVFNSANLIPESEALLEQNVQQFQERTLEKIIVIGHTDNIGAADYNQKLSLERAQAIATKLSQRLSLNADQVEAVGYGMDRPIDTNDTEIGRQNNRRVEFKIYFKDAPSASSVPDDNQVPDTPVE